MKFNIFNKHKTMNKVINLKHLLLLICFNTFSIPIQFKISGFGGLVLDSLDTTDIFPQTFEPSKLILPKDKAQADKIKKLMPDSLIEDLEAKKPYTKQWGTGMVLGTQLEAEVRFDQMIVGVNIGVLYGFAKPEFKKNNPIYAFQEKIDMLEKAEKTRKTAHEETKKEYDKEPDDVKSAFEAQSQELDKQTSEAKDDKEVKHKDIDNIMRQQINPILFLGAHGGYYMTERISGYVSLNLAIRKTKLDLIIPNEPIETRELDWSIGISPGISLKFDLTDKVQFFMQYQAFIFFDEITEKAESLSAQQAAPKATPVKKDKKKKDDDDDKPKPKPQAIAKNGAKHFIGIGLSMRVN